MRLWLSASGTECKSGAECAVLEYSLQNGRISLGKKKLSAQGSEATLSEAKVSHVQAKREDGSIF